jgi:hypothetical protein
MGLKCEGRLITEIYLRRMALAFLPQLLPLGVARLIYADVNLAISFYVHCRIFHNTPLQRNFCNPRLQGLKEITPIEKGQTSEYKP